MSEPEEKDEHGLADSLSGLGQKILGTIENIGGVLTGDPLTQAEGEFNAEVGDVREEIEEDLESSLHEDESDPAPVGEDR